MRPRSQTRYTLALVAATLLARPLEAQTLSFRFHSVDMFGGAVWPQDSEVGVNFGTRVDVAELFSGLAHAGLEIDWWTARRAGADIDVQDIIGGIAVWREFAPRSPVRLFLGLGGAIHSVNVTSLEGAPLDRRLTEAARLDGYRLGASGFVGLTVRLTPTGAIWLVSEYRYTAVSKVQNHELRAGARLLFTRT